jgi:hypothetical protein
MMPRIDTAPVPPPKVTPKDPQPETSGAYSATNSEVESAMNHRWRKTSLRHPVFSSQEFSALNIANAYLGAARVGFEDAVGMLSSSLQVILLIRRFDNKPP